MINPESSTPYKRMANTQSTVVVIQKNTENLLKAPEPDGQERRGSFWFNELNPSERLFLDYVGNGDLDNVKKLLRENIALNLNCTDIQGNSALHLAVKKNDKNMVKFLVSQKKLDPKDCVLHAIKMNEPKILTMILDKVKAMSALAGSKVSLEYQPCINSVDFPQYMTPMMLAAQCGHLEIIQLLLSRQHPPLMSPHQPDCVCDQCVQTLKEKDPLEVAVYKLAMYKALSNPAYICQTTKDPVLLVFHLVIELKKMASRNRVFQSKYEELIEETEKFVAALIGMCRTSDEVKTVLNEREGSNIRGPLTFPRLILAVDYRQKYFVAEAVVQEVLESAWLGDFYDWRGYSDLRRGVHFLGRIFTLPMLYVTCIFMPWSKWARFYSIPLNRMLSHVASYFVFLALLWVESNRDKTKQTRYEIQYHTGWMVLIHLFVATHMFSSARMLFLQGSKRYFSFKWNLYDIVTNLMFLLTFLFWCGSLYLMGDMPDVERKYWHYLDPQLVMEGFFCIGTVMAYSRLLLLVQMDYTLGPMQVSLGKMTGDCFQFIIIFVIVMGSFTAGMCRLYEYYDGMRQVDPETNAVTVQESSFVSTYDTFKVLFWGLFCMSAQEAGAVVIENLPDEQGKLEIINTHDFTQAVGYCLFGVYTVLTVIVLLNMLIAMMSNTFQRVTENVDLEWIFGRTEVFLAFMSQTVLPPPLSFIPAGVGINVTSKLFKGKKEVFDSEEEDSDKFENVMKTLVQRYFSQKDDQDDNADTKSVTA